MKLRHLWETLGFDLMMLGLGLMSLDRASAMGGALGRRLGPLFRVSDLARRNLERALPDLVEAETDRIIITMWDNLGRTAAEYAHLQEFRSGLPDGRIILTGGEVLEGLAAAKKGVIFFGAHLANWELVPAVLGHHGVDVGMIYRAANNPYVDRRVQRRRRFLAPHHFPKGGAGARRIIEHLDAGGGVYALVDQKMNEGIAVDFMGRPAMTAPAVARLAINHGYPLVPVRIERLEGARFGVTVSPPLEMPSDGSDWERTAALMGEVNRTLEDWVRARPEQWFWVHNRWNDI